MSQEQIQVKTFWKIVHFRKAKNGTEKDLEGYISRCMEEWIVPCDIKAIGARIILLCDGDLQRAIDLYGAVTIDSKEDFQHDDLKKNHLFYGQRDAYQHCSGMNDLVILDYLPYPYYFKFNKGDKIYFKGLANKAGELEGDYDVLIDLLYIPMGESNDQPKK